MVPRALVLGLLAVLFATIAAAAALLGAQRGMPYRQARIGGPFAMEDTERRPFTEANLRGKPSAVFFGYTSCPDVCPTTLSDLTDALGRMGRDADQLTIVFATVDPGRDGPERLRDYLSSFDPRIHGLTGTQAQADAMADAYHVIHRRVPGRDGDYGIDHTATVFLMDDTGRLAGEINQGEDGDRMLAKLTALARSGGPSRPQPSGTDRPSGTDLWADAARLARQLCGI